MTHHIQKHKGILIRTQKCDIPHIFRSRIILSLPTEMLHEDQENIEFTLHFIVAKYFD